MDLDMRNFFVIAALSLSATIPLMKATMKLPAISPSIVAVITTMLRVLFLQIFFQAIDRIMA